MVSVTAAFSDLADSPDGFFDAQLREFFEPEETLSYQVSEREEGSANGVLIYISPKPGARMPDPWQAVLQRQGLTWVAAEQSGNDVHVARRVGMALLAIPLLQRSRKINRERVILSGFSGGGRVASMMMPAYPHLFSGALFICGANPLYMATPEALEKLQSTPMTFLSGTTDFNLEDTRMAIASYQQAGVPAQLKVVDGMGHHLPEAIDLESILHDLSIRQ